MFGIVLIIIISVLITIFMWIRMTKYAILTAPEVPGAGQSDVDDMRRVTKICYYVALLFTVLSLPLAYTFLSASGDDIVARAIWFAILWCLLGGFFEVKLLKLKAQCRENASAKATKPVPTPAAPARPPATAKRAYKCRTCKVDLTSGLTCCPGCGTTFPAVPGVP